MSLEANYSVTEKILHRLVLGTLSIGRVSFDLERLVSKHQIESLGEPVFISGLARAGTTILMRTFYSTGLFRSLTYRDMPFVLMPGIWKALSNLFHQHEDERERAHGDGVLVGFDSPEAFEEVFWRSFCAKEYIFDDHISPHLVSDEIIDQFKIFVKHVIASANPKNISRQRYLSKNNNNILRLGSIRKAFPGALIIIPFRDPVQHAFSLLQQHKNFNARNKIDTFTHDYMHWLGHHEFGSTHRPLKFSNMPSALPIDYKTDDINYWLTIWINTYRYILNSAPYDVHYVCFEDMCKSPHEILGALFSDANLSIDLSDKFKNIKSPVMKKSIGNLDSKITRQAQKIYKELLLNSQV